MTAEFKQRNLTLLERMPFRRIRSHFGRLAMVALLFALFPAMSHAEAGELGGIAVFAATAACVIWSVLTLLLFFLILRRVPMLKRIAASVFFLFSPILLLGAAVVEEIAFGESTTQKTEITKKPMVVLGATFPPGSRAEYDQRGGFLGWHADRTLQAIHSPYPIMLGNIPINGMIYIANNSTGEARVELSPGGNVNGWPCDSDTMLNLTPTGPTLRSCYLVAPYTWHGKMYPQNTYVYIGAGMDSPQTE